MSNDKLAKSVADCVKAQTISNTDIMPYYLNLQGLRELSTRFPKLTRALVGIIFLPSHHLARKKLNLI